MSARLCILKILEEFDKNPAALEVLMEKMFVADDLDRRDRGFVFEIVYGIMRNRTAIDYVLNHFLSDERLSQNELLMHILRIGVYQIVYLDRVPEHAAVNESVRLAKNDRRTIAVSGVVNAVLRKIITQQKNLPKPKAKDLPDFRFSVLYSHPQWLVKRWLSTYGLGNTKKILEFNNHQPDVFLRRKIKGLTKQQFESDARSICDTNGGGQGYKNLYYRMKKNILPENIALLREGHCTVQAVSSGWVIALIDAVPGDTILDICAAPGGKCSLLSDLVGNNGAIVACDVRFARMIKVREMLTRMHLGNVYSIVCDGTETAIRRDFKRILIDAPCSGTGVMHRHPESRWMRKPDDITRCASLQHELLEQAALQLSPNGVLVYATCSIEPEENQMQIEAFLNAHPEFVLEPASGYMKDTYVNSVGYLCITPFEHGLDGMFAARLRKKH